MTKSSSILRILTALGIVLYCSVQLYAGFDLVVSAPEKTNNGAVIERSQQLVWGPALHQVHFTISARSVDFAKNVANKLFDATPGLPFYNSFKGFHFIAQPFFFNAYIRHLYPSHFFW